MKVAALILAAGESVRLGRPKQLVDFEGSSLIRRSTQAAVESGCEPVMVVTGAHAEAVEAELGNQSVLLVRNKSWSSGMSGSISSGVKALRTIGAVKGFLILPCDQPFVSSTSLRRLLGHFSGEAAIVAARYDGHLGPPVIFGSAYGPELSELSGNEGARKILKRYPERVIAVEMPEAACDIDTPRDEEALTQLRSGKSG